MESYLKGGLGGVHCTLYIVQCTSYSEKYTVYRRIGRSARGGLGGRHKFLREQTAPRSLIEHCKHFTECNCNISQLSPGIEIYSGRLLISIICLNI